MSSTVLKINIPGLRNSSTQHWQSIWENEMPNEFFRVNQKNWERPDCDTWIKKIELDLQQLSHKNLILIGHSIGCMAIIKWHERFQRQIKGALLVAPSDSESETYPKYITGFSPIPKTVLPFPSIVVGSTNDHVTTLERTRIFSENWGSRLVMLEKAGHIEPKSGFGNWPQGLELVHELASY